MKPHALAAQGGRQDGPGAKASWRCASLVLALVAGLSACDSPPSRAQASASHQAEDGEARIGFANRGGIQNWQAVGDAALLLQDNHGQWYLARLQSPATELPFAEQLGFDTDPSGSFGRLNAVVIKGIRYPIISLTRTEPPAKKSPDRR